MRLTLVAATVAVVFTLVLVMVSQIPAVGVLRRMNLAQMTRLHAE